MDAENNCLHSERFEEWGAFSPFGTFNVDQVSSFCVMFFCVMFFCVMCHVEKLHSDQVPLPFAVCNEYTLETRGAQRVWIAQPGGDLDKRQATLQLCVRALGVQPFPVLIFRGQPSHSPETRWAKERDEEASRYDESVVVFWQAKAWADSEFCRKWASWFSEWWFSQPTFSFPILMLADNLKSHKDGVMSEEEEKALDKDNQNFEDTFKSELAGASAVLRFGVPGATHLWQPIDHGIGAEYKRLIGR